MQRGQLSYAKVRAITRVADSGTEDYFLNIALNGTAHHVEKLVRQFRDVREVAELGREQMQQAHAMGFEITPGTAMTGWRGERMDYGLAIDSLIRRAQLAGTWPQAHKNVSAETSCG